MGKANNHKQEFWSKYFQMKMLDFEPVCPIDVPELQEEAMYDFGSNQNLSNGYQEKNIY